MTALVVALFALLFVVGALLIPDEWDVWR